MSIRSPDARKYLKDNKWKFLTTLTGYTALAQSGTVGMLISRSLEYIKITVKGSMMKKIIFNFIFIIVLRYELNEKLYFNMYLNSICSRFDLFHPKKRKYKEQF